MRLTATLSASFTVYVPDRRGRGLSGPHGDQYSLAKECEDVDALLTTTGAHFVFGHSSGGLVALQAALTLSAIHKVAVYEPPLSIHGSVPTSWVPRYERELARGKLASALITAGKGLPIMRVITIMPRWLLLPFMAFGLWSDRRTLKPDNVSIAALLPTLRFDMQLIKMMSESLEHFKAMRTEACLLGGGKSPAFLLEALDALRQTLPYARHVRYPDLDHDGPIDGDPERIGVDLRTFFA